MWSQGEDGTSSVKVMTRFSEETPSQEIEQKCLDLLLLGKKTLSLYFNLMKCSFVKKDNNYSFLEFS